MVCGASECTEPVGLPFDLPFSTDRGGVVDREGTGTGFTLFDASSRGAGLVTSGLGLDTAAGTLRVTTTAGLAIRGVNSQDNALGVTVPADERALILETVLVAPPAGSGHFEQAGLWYGTSEDDYVKLVVISRHGTRVHMLHERASGVRTSSYGPALPGKAAQITLRLRLDSASRTMTGAYVIGAGQPTRMGTWPLPDGLRESTGGDFVSRAGISASHRLATAPLLYDFDRFAVHCATAGCLPGPAPKDPGMGDGQSPVAGPGDEDDEDGGEEPGQEEPGGGTVPGNPPGAGSTGPTAAPPVPAPVVSPPAPGVSPPVTPRLRFSAPRRITPRSLRRRGLRVQVRCSGSCMTDVDLYAGSVQRGRRLGRVRSRPAGRIVVRLSPRALGRLDRARRIAVRGRAYFSDGSVATVARHIRITRRSR